MKKFLLTIFFVIAISIPVFSLTAPYVGIVEGIYGLSYIPMEGDIKGGTDYGLMSRLEIMLGKKVFFYAHYTVLLPSSVLIYSDLDGFSPAIFGGGLGVGYSLLDARTNNRGHSISIGLVPTFHYGFTSDNLYSYDVISVGAEVFATYYYNVYKNFALRVGANLGVFGSTYSSGTYIKDIDRYETIIYSRGVTINYGLSDGFAF